MKKQILIAIALVLIFSGNLAFAETAQVKIIYPLGGSVGQVGTAQEIKWSTSNYPQGAGVDINLLRKVSSNPEKYELARVIKENTPNDGLETWVPSSSDKGDNLIIQVACSKNVVFAEGCSSSGGLSQIAVSDSSEGSSYIAGVIKSISDSIAKIFEKIKLLKSR